MSKAPEKPKKYEERLMDALDFDEDDLEANQAGQFSPFQRVQFNAEMRRFGLFMAFDALLIAAWLGAAGFISIAAATLPLLFVVAPILAVLLLTYGIKAFRLWSDAREDQVLSEEGRVELSMRGRNANNVECYVKVGDLRFPVKENAFLAFKNGDPYCIYYARRTKKLLSAEWLRENDDNLIDADERRADEEADNGSDAMPDQLKQFRQR